MPYQEDGTSMTSMIAAYAEYRCESRYRRIYNAYLFVYIYIYNIDVDIYL